VKATQPIPDITIPTLQNRYSRDPQPHHTDNNGKYRAKDLNTASQNTTTTAQLPDTTPR
ncbi:Hypothetical predicted protein, partial [Pelobates cultripes]